MKLLLVDDDVQLRKVVHSCIKTFLPNAEIQECSDVREAVKCFRTNTPDAIFTDYNMPNHSGEFFAIWLRENKYEKPIVLLTGDTGQVKDASLFNQIVAKPMSTEVLDDILNRLVGGNL